MRILTFALALALTACAKVPPTVDPQASTALDTFRADVLRSDARLGEEPIPNCEPADKPPCDALPVGRGWTLQTAQVAYVSEADQEAIPLVNSDWLRGEPGNTEFGEGRIVRHLTSTSGTTFQSWLVKRAPR